MKYIKMTILLTIYWEISLRGIYDHIIIITELIQKKKRRRKRSDVPIFKTKKTGIFHCHAAQRLKQMNKSVNLLFKKSCENIIS